MKKLCLMSIMLSLCGSALAAPLPVPEKAINNHWNGAYLGVVAGPAWGSDAVKINTGSDTYLGSTDAAAVNQAGTLSVRPQGFSAGVEAGYNWLLGRFFMLGLESDAQTLRLGDSSNSGNVPYPVKGGSFVEGAYLNMNWLATLRPRMGVVFDHWLFYATAGVALTELHGNFYFNDNASALESGSIDMTKAGPALGAGVEVEVTKRWNVKAEYLYINFGQVNATQTGSTVTETFPYQTFNYSARYKAYLARLGLNYRFDL